MAAPEGGPSQVEQMERVVAQLAEKSAPCWVSGGVTIGSEGVDTAEGGKRRKTEEQGSAKRGGALAWAAELTRPGGGSAAATGGAGDAGSVRNQESGWRCREGGLQTVAEAYGRHNSASQQQAEFEKRLEQMDEDYSLPRNHTPQGYIDMSRCEMASMEKPIPASNLGHQMLLRMGWRGQGSGIGRHGSGIYDPIPLTTKDIQDLSSRIGLGKAEEEGDMHVLATENRNALESEIQANESSVRRERREEMVQKKEEITLEVKEIVSIFRCEICDKQYSTDAQFQEHLNSYDHHHKKRFDDYRKEEQARRSGGTSVEERQRKEQRRMEKEMAARAEAIRAAAAARESAPPAASPAPLTAAAGTLGAAAAPVKMSFGGGNKLRAGNKGATRGGARLGVNAAAARAPASSIFGADEDDEP